MVNSTNAYSPENCILVIPARRHSTRLPDKMLLRETGKTLLEHTFLAASKAKNVDAIVIATDDEEIEAEARRFGAQVVMTRPDCPSGTDRVAEVARAIPEAQIIINLQGDEPETDPQSIDQLASLLKAHPKSAMATLAAPIRDRTILNDPASVKVVFDNQGRAMYFSRSPIPYPREWDASLLSSEPPTFFLHIGMYAFRREMLLRFASLPMSRTEQIEKLEQLRILEQGETILIGQIDHATRGIDTPHDYAAFVARHRARQPLAA